MSSLYHLGFLCVYLKTEWVFSHKWRLWVLELLLIYFQSPLFFIMLHCLSLLISKIIWVQKIQKSRIHWVSFLQNSVKFNIRSSNMTLYFAFICKHCITLDGNCPADHVTISKFFTLGWVLYFFFLTSELFFCFMQHQQSGMLKQIAY